nr:SGNH/GDSL hydrolase family protein [uncultured Pedobacter sp.]
MKLRNYITAICLSIFTIALFAFKQDKPLQIVCFGDSITFGAKVDGHSWVSFLKEDHPEVDFVNAGRSGRKTADKKELLPVLEKYPSADKYLIFLGVNDLKDGNDSMVNNNVENMKWMVAEIKKVNPKAEVVILAPTDINLKTMDAVNVKKKYNQNTKTSLYHLKKCYKKLAKAEGLGFISLLHAVSKPNYADGLHPNLAGQKEIATVVWKGLK